MPYLPEPALHALIPSPDQRIRVGPIVMQGDLREDPVGNYEGVRAESRALERPADADGAPVTGCRSILRGDCQASLTALLAGILLKPTSDHRSKRAPLLAGLTQKSRTTTAKYTVPALLDPRLRELDEVSARLDQPVE